MKKLLILTILTVVGGFAATNDLGVLYNTSTKQISPTDLKIGSFQVDTNLTLPNQTADRAMVLDSLGHAISSGLSGSQVSYLASMIVSTNWLNLDGALIISGSAAPTNSSVPTNRVLYINKGSTSLNNTFWGNYGGTWYTLASTNAGAITEAQFNFSDNTTADVSITQHGLAPKAPNDINKFLRGDATWASPFAGVAGTTDVIPLFTTLGSLTLQNSAIKRISTGPDWYQLQGNLGTFSAYRLWATNSLVAGTAIVDDIFINTSLVDRTNGDVSITSHGFAPKAPNDATKFLNGLGTWSVPPGAGGGTVGIVGSPVANMATYWSGVNTITGTANYTFDPVAQQLHAPAIDAYSYNFTSGGNVSSGTYAPTLTAVLGGDTAVTGHQLYWTRVGNNVSVSGMVEYHSTPVTSHYCSFRVSLPVAITGTGDESWIAGSAVEYGKTTPASMAISWYPTNEAVIAGTPSGGGYIKFMVNFSYRIQ